MPKIIQVNYISCFTFTQWQKPKGELRQGELSVRRAGRSIAKNVRVLLKPGNILINWAGI